eukprot:tig00000939_g5481.t1
MRSRPRFANTACQHSPVAVTLSSARTAPALPVAAAGAAAGAPRWADRAAAVSIAASAPSALSAGPAAAPAPAPASPPPLASSGSRDLSLEDFLSTLDNAGACATVHVGDGAPLS